MSGFERFIFDQIKDDTDPIEAGYANLPESIQIPDVYNLFPSAQDAPKSE
jgi:hypothetical protein